MGTPVNTAGLPKCNVLIYDFDNSLYKAFVASFCNLNLLNPVHLKLILEHSESLVLLDDEVPRNKTAGGFSFSYQEKRVAIVFK